jgi:hypothetical protein
MTHLRIFTALILIAFPACGMEEPSERTPVEEGQMLGPAGDGDCSEPGSCVPAEESDNLVTYGLEGQVTLDGTSGILKYTRITVIGNGNNITKVYFAVHGDGNSDYASSTSGDRTAMAKHLASGEGAIVAYPVSKSSNWPGFDGGKNGYVLLKMFRHLERLTGNTNMRFEQFSLSGGGRVNHALLRLINENYSSDSDVREFVDNHLRGIHDGDSLCYSISQMEQNYIKAIKSFDKVRFCFIHNTSGQMSYVQSHHNNVAKAVSNQSYSYGGSLTLQDGRLRFWSSKTHWTAWQGQFEKVFFGTNWGEGDDPVTPPPPPPPPTGDAFVGEICAANASCASGVCLSSFHFPDSVTFPDGMCTTSCDRKCDDEKGHPETFCVSFDLQNGAFGGNQGQCFSRCDTSYFSKNGGCRDGYQCVKMPRNNESSTKRNVCIPASGKGDEITFGGIGEPADEEGNLPNPERVAGGCSLNPGQSTNASAGALVLLILLGLVYRRRN